MSRRSLALLVALTLLAGPSRSATPPASPEPPQAPSAGEVLPAFDAESLDGTVRHVGFAKGTTTILLFFLSSCPTCHRMIPEWSRLYDKRPKGLQILGVIMDKEPPGFFMAMPISFPVVRSPAMSFLRAHKINRVPLTLRVAGGGRVEDVGLGYLDPIRLGELFRP